MGRVSARQSLYIRAFSAKSDVCGMEAVGRVRIWIK